MLSRPKGQRESLFLKGFDETVEICDGGVALRQFLFVVFSLTVEFLAHVCRLLENAFHIASCDQIGYGHLCVIGYLIEILGDETGLPFLKAPVGAGVDSEFLGEFLLGHPKVFPDAAEIVFQTAFIHAAKIRSNDGFYISALRLTTMQ